MDGMTNGEVIQALFPNGKVINRDEAIGYEQMLDDKYSYCSWFDGLWWNAPYKADYGMKYKICCPLCDNEKCVRGTDKCEAEIWAKRMEEGIEALSAEPCEDAISRTDLLESFCKDCERFHWNGDKCCTSKCEEYHLIASMPRVKPVACIGKVEFDEEKMQEIVHEVAENMIVECEDCISRNDTIEWLKKVTVTDGITFETGFKQILTDIRNAPSVQPKQKMGRWIPVSERLPDNNARVLCCATSTSISGGYTRFVGCCNNGFWFVQTSAETLSYPRQYEVTAWMPLPEPYKAESEE